MNQGREPTGGDLVRDAYATFGQVLKHIDEAAAWTPTGCIGWTVRDLTYHCLLDAQRALVALHTPATAQPNRDFVTYCQDWTHDERGAANGRRFTRVASSMFLQWSQLRDVYLETSTAVIQAAPTLSVDQVVRTQGHTLASNDLLRTLSVEATIHHLDLIVHLPSADKPAAFGLADVRRVLDGLLGHQVAVQWADEHYARAATGRVQLTDAEQRQLGQDASRFPLFR